jgi:hypothetical protein
LLFNYTGLIMSEHNKNYINFQNAFVLHDVFDIILVMRERNESITSRFTNAFGLLAIF